MKICFLAAAVILIQAGIQFNPLKGICAQVEIQLYAYAVYKLCPLPFRYTITKVVIICFCPLKERLTF